MMPGNDGNGKHGKSETKAEAGDRVMSTNYYAKKTEDILANLDEDGLSVTVSKKTTIHIGKSNGGRAFMLHIYPKLGITSEDSMMAHLAEGWTISSDLYGRLTLVDLKEAMKLEAAPVYRDVNCVGSSRNCDYYVYSFS